jgi:UDP-3-O-[3-hydroxymyristoyl] N-acetylglucosamine deacetylase
VFLLQRPASSCRTPPKRFLRILKPVEVREGEGPQLKWARLEPFEGYKLTFEIDFDHPAGQPAGPARLLRHGLGPLQAGDRARPHLRLHEGRRDDALARPRRSGGSMDNALVVDDVKVLNGEGLRYDDEFVKHKILDAIGDMYVIGHPLIAAYTAYKSGHALNNKLVRAVLADREAYDIVTFDDPSRAPAGLADLAPAW